MIPALAPDAGHDWGEWVVTKPATDTETGEESRTCSRCSETETQVIPKTKEPISIEGAELVLEKAAFTYNGKVQKPSVKTAGGYTLSVTGKGDYTGASSVARYRINPKSTSVSKLAAAKKAVTVKWKKQATKMSRSRITGYQIQLATNKGFTKDEKIVTVKGYKKVSKKVTKLKGRKKYYVRVRTYKTIKGVRYCSKWSVLKTVKTL